MNNLKRVLSLGLAGTMLTGMMMVGASAANKEFTDAEEITHTEAVNSMAALGVIAGKDTGAFDPEGIVTRAEMAKIICVMLSGGVDPTLGVKATPTYSDIKGHWAESYIEYCSSIGIIAGQGDGTFGPDATVTSSAAAKMFMVALGYDSDVFGFTGVDWEINTNREASDAKLYEDLKGIAVSEGMTRDSAAQMAYNALDAKVMEKTYDKVQSNGEISYNYKLSDDTSFLNKYFDAHTFIGTYTGNHDTGASSNKGEVAVYGKLDNATAESAKVTATFPSDMDISNIGEEVKIIFKDGKGGSANKPDKKDTIYGVFNTGATTVYDVTMNDIQDSESSTKIKFGDVKYDIDTTNGVEVVTNYITESPTGTYTSASTLQGLIKKQSVDTIKFVANEDGKISRAYITTYGVGKVSGVTSSKVTITGIGAIELEDNNVYEGIAKDDVVFYTKFYAANKDDATFTITKAETAEGELTGYKYDSTNSVYVNVVVDGTTYKANNKPATFASLTDDAITTPGTDGKIGDTVRLYLVNGMVCAIQSIENGIKKYAVVTEVNTGDVNSNMDPLKVAVLLPDGSKQTLSIHKDSTFDGTNKFKDQAAATQQGKFDTTNKVGTLVEYSSIANGQIKLKNVVAQPGTAITGGAATTLWNKDTKELTYYNAGASANATAVAATDAVMFVGVDNVAGAQDGKVDNWYAYNMRGLGKILNTSGGVKVSYIKSASNGLIVAAYVTLPSKPGTNSADTLYGMVTGYIGSRNNASGDTLYRYTVTVGRDEDVEINLDTASLAAGDLIRFDEASDGEYTYSTDILLLVTANDTAESTESRTTIAAVKDYNESNRLLTYYTGTSRLAVNQPFTGSGLTSATVDKDVKIVYVDAKENEAGSAVGVNTFDASNGYANVVFHKDTEGVIDAMIVETSGKANLAVYGNPKNAPSSTFGVPGAVYAMTGAPKATVGTVDVTVTANDATVENGMPTSFTVTVATPAAGTAGITSGTITVALSNLGGASLSTTTGTNCTASLMGTTLTITISVSATATSGTFVVSGTPTANVTASVS